MGVAGGLGEGLWALRVLAAQLGAGAGGGSGGGGSGARGRASQARAGGGGGGSSSPGGGPGPGGGESSLDLFLRSDVPKKLGDVLLLIALARLGTYVPLSGVDRAAFQEAVSSGSSPLLSYADALSGGSIAKVGAFSLGIVPAINASILLQVLSSAIPQLKKLVREEGSAGRDKYKQYEKYLTVAFAVAGAVGQALYLRPYVPDFDLHWLALATLTLTAGACLTALIGEEITECKLGNGTSVLIFVNIASAIPASLAQTLGGASEGDNAAASLAVFLLAFLVTVVGVVYVQAGERRIPINYARFSTRAQRERGAAGGSAALARGSSQPFLPFKVNAAGVMPVIFSSSFLALPSALARFTGSPAVYSAAKALGPGGPLYFPLNIALIVYFNYFYTFLQLEPEEVAKQLKRQGASVPQVRPGKSTADYITQTLERMSVLGSVFLGLLALSPGLVEVATGLQTFRGFAGTSLLILVGVATDTARRVTAEVQLAEYDVDKLYDDLDGKTL